MKRTAIYSHQIVSKNGKFIGVNLGYDHYYSHESGTEQIVEVLNKMAGISDLYDVYRMSVFEKKRLQKRINKQYKLIERWQYTPFNGYVVLPGINYLVREIIVDNSSIKHNYKRFMVEDGEYTLLILGARVKSWVEKYGNRRKFSEDNLLYMTDYNPELNMLIPDFKVDKNYNPTEVNNFGFISAWSSQSDEIMILMNKQKCTINIVEGITQAIKNGSLAIVDREPRLFFDRGCILIDLDAAYNSYN